MPKFFLRTTNCGDDVAVELSDQVNAWADLKETCCDLVRGAMAGLEPDKHWQIELHDESHTPVYRIRITGQILVAATLALPAVCLALRGPLAA
ncbi:MAG: hypothetical protein JOY90_02480 [Bradyrhizobium sp.]|uniref:DUF6894 family protein n=1 Tax=Bradyrhizobium sp. TaxID=376 RepID=UPI001DE188CE|nr:hypothetical protein [Bradyrhizobium sp.]MBV9559318.1 hypothetical protein [Bradyrhizobium sp.]